MNQVKPFPLAGQFYPETHEQMDDMMKCLFANLPHDYNTYTRAIIVPHSNYEDSGVVAANAYQYLDKNIKNIFIISPAHFQFFFGLSLSPHEKWGCPIGTLDVNQDINKEIANKIDAELNDRTFESEHSIDVQIPFLKNMLPDAKIVPIIVGSCNFRTVLHIVESFWDNPENGFVFTTDLSHFYTQEDAAHFNEYVANFVEERNSTGSHIQSSSGSNALIVLTEFAREKGFSLIRVDLKTSVDSSAKDKKIASYGSWILNESSKQEFLKEQFSSEILSICKKSITSGVDIGSSYNVNTMSLPPVFHERGAVFIQLYIDKKLRGMSGTYLAYQPLAEDISMNAFKAAFRDPLTPVLESEELDKIEYDIHLLTRLVELAFKNEEHFLEQITDTETGIVLKDGGHYAIGLPYEWEEHPDKRDFVNAIKAKAELPPEHWSENIRAFKFKAARIQG